MNNKFLNIAADLARNYAYDRHIEYHLCSIVTRGGKILGIGFNRLTHNKIVREFRVKEHCNFVHAELDAIVHASRKVDSLRGCKMYTVRVRKLNSEMAMALPCDMCKAAIKSHGIKRATYSIDNENYGVFSGGC